jgi:hypothetical protein
MGKQAFTAKAMIFGLIGLVIVCVFQAYSAGDVIRGYLPIVPLFLIALLSFGWNMTAGRIARRLTLSAGELALIFGLMLAISWIPAMQRAFVRQMVLPRYEELTTNTTWREAGVTTRLPARLFPRGQDGEIIGEKTHLGMIQGGMTMKEVPYRQWVEPLLNWMPFVLVLALSLLALSLMVHRQWTKHEQLRYPLVAVVDALIQQDTFKPGGAIFRNRLFRVGFAFVFGIQLLRYLHQWYPSNIPAISMDYGLGWNRLFPSIVPSNASMFVLNWMPISFAVIGIAFLVPTDVSLSMGLTAPLGTLFAVQYYLVTGSPMSAGSLETFRVGGFIAFAAILTYTGRTYYFPILRKAIGLGRGEKDIDPGGVWAARVFLAGYLALVLVVAGMGVGLPMAWIIVTFVLLMFLVVTRLVCESGLPMLVSGWSLPGLLSGLLGPAALGSTPLMFVMFLSSTIAGSNSSQLAMPYMATSLKLLDDNKVHLQRFAIAAKIAIVAALAVGFAAVITIAYTKGGGNLNKTERAVWTQGVNQVLGMKDFGQYEASEAASGVARLGLVRPDGGTVRLVLTGLVVVIACYMLRFRFAKWPLHPLFFLVLGTGASSMSWTCFLLGWLIKTLVVKVGGSRVYRLAQPLFIGFIMGEFMCLAMAFAFGLIYRLVTGNEPVATGF